MFHRRKHVFQIHQELSGGHFPLFLHASDVKANAESKAKMMFSSRSWICFPFFKTFFLSMNWYKDVLGKGFTSKINIRKGGRTNHQIFAKAKWNEKIVNMLKSRHWGIFRCRVHTNLTRIVCVAHCRHNAARDGKQCGGHHADEVPSNSIHLISWQSYYRFFQPYKDIVVENVVGGVVCSYPGWGKLHVVQRCSK